jgi:asparaginyl-tRNA synthetase
MTKSQLAKFEGFVIKQAEMSFHNQGFVPLFPPKVVRASGACENVNTLFDVQVEDDDKWFGRSAYLSQTGQLYLEAYVAELNKVYCLGPSFRAEPKIDDRHLTEFMMLEIEFAGDFNDLLSHIESMIYHLAQMVGNSQEAIAEFGLDKATTERLLKCPPVLTKLTYDQAITKLKELGEKIEWGDDISSKREKILLANNNEQPLFITHYPDPMWDHGKEIEVEKFFNMLPDKKTPGRVLSSDLILPFGGEAVGAAARVDSLEVLIARLENSKMYQRLVEKGGDLQDFEWYIEHLKKHGTIPHAGCGFGLSRIMQWIGGFDDITKAVSFPSNKGCII